MQTFRHPESAPLRAVWLGAFLFVLACAPVSGFLADFDGDGVLDEATYHARTGQWDIHSGATAVTTRYQFGSPATMPVPGDYDGDGRTDLAVYEFERGNWFVWSSLRDTIEVWQWGFPGALPLPDDVDGDGTTESVIYDPASGVTYIRPELQDPEVPAPGRASAGRSALQPQADAAEVEHQSPSAAPAAAPPSVDGPMRRIVVLGDSLALGAGASSAAASWADGVARELYGEEELLYYNFSIGGSGSGDVLAEQLAVYSPLWFLSNPLAPVKGPTLVLLTAGGNDLLGAQTVGGEAWYAGALRDTMENVTRIDERLHDWFPDGATLCVATGYDPTDGRGYAPLTITVYPWFVLPTGSGGVLTPLVVEILNGVVNPGNIYGIDFRAGVDAYRAAMSRLAEEKDFTFIDLVPVFEGHGHWSSTTGQEGWLADEVHPNDLGHQAIQQIFLETLAGW